MQKSLKDLLAGLCFVGFGLAFGYAAYSYDLGTALRMGPGYFPLVLAGILVLLGVLIVVEGFVDGDLTPIGGVPWRGLVLLLGALFVFGFTVRGLGLAPALFLAVLLSAFASRRTGIVGALVMAIALTGFCILIFIYGLGVPVRLFGPWWPL